MRLYLSKCTTPCKMTNLHIDIKPTLFFSCQYHLKWRGITVFWCSLIFNHLCLKRHKPWERSPSVSLGWEKYLTPWMGVRWPLPIAIHPLHLTECLAMHGSSSSHLSFCTPMQNMQGESGSLTRKGVAVLIIYLEGEISHKQSGNKNHSF